jgi:hypothetical protein
MTTNDGGPAMPGYHDLIRRDAAITLCQPSKTAPEESRAAMRVIEAGLRALPAVTPRPMGEAPQRFVARAVLTEEGWCGTMRPDQDGGWVLWDDVAHLFPAAPEDTP